MKIIQLLHSFPPETFDGVEKYTYLLSKELINQGHNVKIISGSYKFSPENPRGFFREVEVFRLSSSRLCGRYMNGFNNLINFKKSIELIEEFNPDIVHFQHLMHFSPLLLTFLEKKKIPVVLTLHDYWILCPSLTFFTSEEKICKEPGILKCGKCLAKRDSYKSPYYSAITALREALFKPLNDKRLTLISPSLNLIKKITKYFPNLKPLKLSNFVEVPPKKITTSYKSAVSFLYLGGLRKIKGYELIKKLLEINGRTFRLYSYGAYFTDNRVINYQNFAWENLEEVFSGVNCILYPSLWDEIQPITLIEGVVRGISFIGSSIGGIREFKLLTGRGLLFKRGDIIDFSRTVDFFIDNFNQINQENEKLLNRRPELLEYFNPGLHLKKISEIYAETTEKTKNG